MVQALRIDVRVAALAAAVVGLMACGDGGGGTGVQETGRIQADVTLDDGAAEGVTVELFSTGGATALSSQQTGSAGRATFGSLEAGAYDVAVDPPAGAEMAAGDDDRKSVNVTAGGTASVAFDLVSSGAGGTTEVSLTSSLTFSPSNLTISAGTTVVWRNAAAIFHTITPDGHSEWQRATVTQTGQTFSHTFNTPGTYAYYCEPHRSAGMTGVITVE